MDGDTCGNVEAHMGASRNWGTLLGVREIRVIVMVFWGLCRGPPFRESTISYHVCVYGYVYFEAQVRLSIALLQFDL